MEKSVCCQCPHCPGPQKGEPKDPFTALKAWMAEHVAEVARTWDSEVGRTSWEAYRRKYMRQGALAPSTEVGSAWLLQCRRPAIRCWVLAAALEQEIVDPEEALAYLKQASVEDQDFPPLTREEARKAWRDKSHSWATRVWNFIFIPIEDTEAHAA